MMSIEELHEELEMRGSWFGQNWVRALNEYREESMIHPTIHLNGTSKRDLLRQWEEASNALRASLTKMGDAMPHDRDYYPQGPHAGPEARRQHIEHMNAIRAAMLYLESLAEHAQVSR